jgi:hypothetical protein
MIITENGPKTIGQIQKYFQHGDMFLSPVEYQRENAWDLDQKKLLIDTIFRHLDMPKFYLWKIDHGTLANGYPDSDAKEHYKAVLERKRKENDEADPCVYEVVDGQQRIRTILEYMTVKLPNGMCYRGVWLDPFDSLGDTPIAKGKHYRQLNAEQQLKFEEFSLTVKVLESATIGEVREMFLRLQNGTPLNAQQKRDALGSEVGAKARVISELPFFAVAVPFGNETGDHRRIASQMLLLEYKGKIAPCTSQRLDKFYKDKRAAGLDAALVGRAKKIVEMMGKIFPANNPNLNRSYALGIYWALSRLLLTYTIADAELPKIKSNFERLDVARCEAMGRDYSAAADDVFNELSLSMSHGTDGSEKMETRHDILMQFLFDGVALTLLPKLDPQRDFTYEEKLILYHRAGGRCQLSCNGKVCGRPVPFDEAAIDHIVPHSKGGKTELANGRYAARSCNIARGARDDFDPATQCCYLKQPAQAAGGET